MLLSLQMESIRVLIGHHPGMTPDAICQLVTERMDMEFVGDRRGPMKILQETGRANADAVILANDGAEEPGLCSQLLAVYSDLITLCVTTDLTSAFTQQLWSRRRDFIGVEHYDIAQTLRIAVRIPCGEKLG
jgi:hypothetical protein